jgi:3-deoxy-7-phosphoheptulonate synthase
MSERLSNVNIAAQRLLPTPSAVKEQHPLSPEGQRFIGASRAVIEAILDGRDHRRFLVVGPCSIHDLEAATEYANRLRELADEVRDTLVLVMRVYFSKPRTTIGWKGFINDPYLDDSFRIDEGLNKARQFLLALADLQLPAGTEALDPIIPQYLDDLVSWNAIGARTTESQTHREMASGLSTPVGFKNGTDGNVLVAIQAMQSASRPHHFLGINEEGQVTVLETAGNRYSHIVLRGGDRPNYDSVCVAICRKRLREHSLPENIMIDCSHGNSMKDPDLQPLVLDNCVHQILEGNRSIVGMMLESHLHAGNQKIGRNLSKLAFGVSVTDACIDWQTTEQAIRKAHRNLSKGTA